MSQAAIAPLPAASTSGSQLALKLTNFEQAHLTTHSGSARPSYVQAGMIWLDTTTTPWVLKLYNGSQDIGLFGLSSASHRKRAPVVEATIASASTTDVLGSTSDYITVSGTATITSLGTEPMQIKYVRASGAFTLQHNATSLILPTGANIVAAANDSFIVVSDSSGNARVLAYQRNSGSSLVAPAAEFASGGVVTIMFFQAAAPTGWTQNVTHNDKALRIVNTAGGGSGGSLNFSTVFGYTVTGGTVLTQAHLPDITLFSTTDGSHTHGLNNAQDVVRDSGSSLARGTGSNSFTKDDITMDSGGSHNHDVPLGGSDTAHTHPNDTRVRYIDIIACSKN